jgi:hypothetical protein
MESTTQHFGVPQFQGDHIKTFLLQKLHERGLMLDQPLPISD